MNFKSWFTLVRTDGVPIAVHLAAEAFIHPGGLHTLADLATGSRRIDGSVVE